MTIDMVLIFTILLVTIALFVTERLRVDLVALLVLAALALTGLVTASEALSGFSNPAVITVWAVFILSGGLSRTGVANVVGRSVLRFAGSGEVRLMVVIMLVTGIMSAFMNNVGVAALFLPVVMDIARRTGIPPSKLLMPLAFGSLLGGLTTLIGTPPNILAGDALRDFGLEPYRLFDFARVGLVVMLIGVAYMALVGRRLLPTRDLTREVHGSSQQDLGEIYDLRERLFVVAMPPDSVLIGKSLVETRLGTAVGLNVVGILHDGQTRLAPDPHTIIQPGSRLLVAGRLDRLMELHGHQNLVIEETGRSVADLISAEIDVSELGLSPASGLLGQTLQQIGFRQRYGVIVLAIWRDGFPLSANLDDLPLQEGDILLVQGGRLQIEALSDLPEFVEVPPEQQGAYQLDEMLMNVRITADSHLVGKTLADSRLAEAFGLTVLGIIRDGQIQLMPDPQVQFQAGDLLLVKGRAESLLALRGLQDLEVDIDAEPELSDLETERFGLVEAMLSPHTTLVGRTLRGLHFREKYGLNVLAIYRDGRAYRSNLQEMGLRFGDALLLFGLREKLKLLAAEPDFLVLAEDVQEAPRLEKALLAALIMAGVVVSVLVGWLPISIAAVVGATLMVLTGCLTMEEAYRFIDWRAVFLIAGMLPLGIAMGQSGAAQFLAEGVIAGVGGFGSLALIAGLFILTSLASQVMPNAVVTVLMAPIAINTAVSLNLSPYALVMVVAIAASASFLSPVGHPANVLIMGPGGYRFTDFVKVGLPLTILILLAVLVALPVFWPLVP